MTTPEGRAAEGPECPACEAPLFLGLDGQSYCAVCLVVELTAKLATIERAGVLLRSMLRPIHDYHAMGEETRKQIAHAMAEWDKLSHPAPPAAGGGG